MNVHGNNTDTAMSSFLTKSLIYSFNHITIYSYTYTGNVAAITWLPRCQGSNIELELELEMELELELEMELELELEMELELELEIEMELKNSNSEWTQKSWRICMDEVKLI